MNTKVKDLVAIMNEYDWIAIYNYQFIELYKGNLYNIPIDVLHMNVFKLIARDENTIGIIVEEE